MEAAVHSEAVPTRTPKARVAALAVAAVGLVLSIAALVADSNRFSHAYLMGFCFVWCVVAGSLFFVALHHLTGAVWSVVVRRVAEALAAPAWLLVILFVPLAVFVILPGYFELYPWTDPEVVAHEQVLQQKQAYLNVPFFLVRGAAFLAIWAGFATYFIKNSTRQDLASNALLTVRMRKASPLFMLLFAVSVTFAGIDWLMSLEPRWFSTIFGVYIFSGMMVTALASIIFVTLALRRCGYLSRDVVTGDHLYNLGALLFAFVCFWAYIAFSQYMLIWYANMPEESFYIVQRLEGGWFGVTVVLALVRFVIPFFALLSRRAKMHAGVLFPVSLLILIGQVLDLYWLIMPQAHTAGPVFGWHEAGPILLMAGLAAWVVMEFLERHPALPIGDPLLEESKRFRL